MLNNPETIHTSTPFAFLPCSLMGFSRIAPFTVFRCGLKGLSLQVRPAPLSRLRESSYLSPCCVAAPRGVPWRGELPGGRAAGRLRGRHDKRSRRYTQLLRYLLFSILRRFACSHHNSRTPLHIRYLPCLSRAKAESLLEPGGADSHAARIDSLQVRQTCHFYPYSTISLATASSC
jgi:hypothetical protein